MSRRLSIALILAAAGTAAVAAQDVKPTSCVSCHGNPAVADDASVRLVHAVNSKDDVHAAAGLACQECHGGNPDPKMAEDPDGAMDPKFAKNPFRGAPERRAIPEFCGRCHSDPAYMRRFKPDLRVDQLQEYWTSQHGKLLKTGDAKVAVCVDCHGAHGILGPSDPRSGVYPTHVADTCARCHADAKHMAGYVLADGRPLPIDQFARWRQSVHAHAMYDKEDLTAPTCNDCHGNHGAAPPGIDSVAFVCGHCHGREADLFRASPKRKGFEEHNVNLKDAGPDGCKSCHAAPDPSAMHATVRAFSECVTCHGNHGIVRPTIAMLSPLPATPCAFCHEPPSLGGDVPEPAAKLEHYLQLRDALLAEATRQNLAPNEVFDWLVDRALALPTHTLEEAAPGAQGPVLRPEFRRLFEKFRLGKSYYTYKDPTTGADVKASVTRCSDCHAAEPTLTTEPVGLSTSHAFLDRMRDLVGHTARAERILLAARRGGVETKSTLLEIDHAIDSQIELEVLVHSFSIAKQSPFEAKAVEGAAHARAALVAGQTALQELSFRRRGLAVTLGFVLLVLVALGLKIRQLSRDRGEE